MNFLRKKSNVFWIVFNACIIGLAGILLACYDFSEDELYYLSNFAPETVVDKEFKPFFYTSLAFYDVNHDLGHLDRFRQINIDEWYDYFKNNIPKSEIEALLYVWDKKQVNELSLRLNSEAHTISPPERISKLTLYNKRAELPAARFIKYLTLARECEKFAATEPVWYYEEKPTAPPIIDALESELSRALSAEADPFLKKRYWFQMVRYYFFHPQNDGYSRAIHLFDEYSEKMSKDNMYYRTMGYAAGAYYKSKNYAQANYYYSLLYARSRELKIPAHYCFHPQQEADWNATLLLAKNKEEKIVLWHLLGYYYDAPRAITEILKLDPTSHYADLLLSRIVNEAEANSIEYASGGKDPVIGKKEQNKTGGPFWDITKDSALVARLNWMDSLSQIKNLHRPYAWHWASGYLYWLNGDYKKADEKYLAAAALLPAKDDLVQAQHRIFVWMNNIASLNTIDENTEKILLPEIKWLQSVNIEVLRKEAAYAYSLDHLSEIYKRQKSILKSECMVHRDSFYTDQNKIDKMKEFMQRHNRTDFENLLLDIYPVRLEDIYDFEGTMAVLKGDFQQAIYFYKKSGESDISFLKANPFNMQINDCHDCDHQRKQSTYYTKLSLAEKMKEMADNIEAGEDVYNNASLLANAYYNISHYGNGRALYESTLIGWGHYSPEAISKAFRQKLISNEMAEKYYLLARANTEDPEKKAKMTFYAAKCENNKIYNQRYYLNEGKDEIYEWERMDKFYIPRGKYYQEMSEKYSQTNFAKQAIKECGYFQKFMKKQGH